MGLKVFVWAKDAGWNCWLVWYETMIEWWCWGSRNRKREDVSFCSGFQLLSKQVCTGIRFPILGKDVRVEEMHPVAYCTVLYTKDLSVMGILLQFDYTSYLLSQAILHQSFS